MQNLIWFVVLNTMIIYDHRNFYIILLNFSNINYFQAREKGKNRFHRLQNVRFALEFLNKRKVRLVNIRAEDIVDGNPKLILGLIWSIILHFQVSNTLRVFLIPNYHLIFLKLLLILLRFINQRFE